jgi:hypothetical protein
VALPGRATPARRTIRALSAAPAHSTPVGPEGAGGEGSGGGGGGGESVAARFEAALGRGLRHGGMPAVDVGAGAEPEWVPAELCRWEDAAAGGWGARSRCCVCVLRRLCSEQRAASCEPWLCAAAGGWLAPVLRAGLQEWRGRGGALFIWFGPGAGRAGQGTALCP